MFIVVVSLEQLSYVDSNLTFRPLPTWRGGHGRIPDADDEWSSYCHTTLRYGTTKHRTLIRHPGVPLPRNR